MNECKCEECKTQLHDSDCAVHNEPATPNGDCDCKDGWIRVSDGLPEAFVNQGGSEFSAECLVVDNCGDITIACYMYPWRNMDCLGWTSFHEEGMKKEDVTHWQPLPHYPLNRE